MKRNDAKRIYDMPTLIQVYPYLMKRRCDSMVFQSMVMDLTAVVDFVKENKAPDGHTYRIFEVMISALLRTIALRPELNRFIANKCYWQRDELSINFIVKEDYTDEAPEHSMPMYFRPDMTLDEMATIINNTITEERKKSNEGFTDKAISFFFSFPRWFITSVIGLAGFLDKHGKAPKALRDADGLHTSVYISNLGSIGLGGSSPHHHLYEWGTTSLFVTLGMLHRKKQSNGEFRDFMEVGFTVDERITDGWYFTKSVKLFQNFLNHPESLLGKPTKLPSPVLSKKQFKAQKKDKKREAKKASVQKAPSNVQ